MNGFRILWGFNALMSLMPVGYFFVGLGDGSITASNMGMWMILLLVVAGILGGSVWLRNNNRPRIAWWVLILGAAPYALMIILYLATVLSGGNRGWQ